jgi:hypothetical protein
MSEGVNDASISATRKDHQPFPFHVEKERLLTTKIIWLELFATPDERTHGTSS